MEENITQPPKENAPKKKRFPKWAKVVIGIFVFIIVVIVVAFVATAGPVKTAEKQLVLLKAGDINGAYELTSGEFKNATSLEAFTAFVKQYPSLTKNKSHTFTERTVENNQGTIKGSLTAEDGTVTPITYMFVKEQGKWLILSIDLNPS